MIEKIPVRHRGKLVHLLQRASLYDTLAGFVLAQLYVGARIFVKLHFLASQTALFQASLAHAAWTAAPLPAWPDSPAAETIAPASR